MAGAGDNGEGPLVADHVDVDLLDPDTFAAKMPDEAFGVLRRAGGHTGSGFWCITTYPDIQTVSMQTDVFSSWLGGFTGADTEVGAPTQRAHATLLNSPKLLGVRFTSGSPAPVREDR